MPEHKSLMSRRLEDQSKASSTCEIVHAAIALWTEIQSIGIKQDRLLTERPMIPLTSLDTLTGDLDEVQRIAPSRTQQFDHQRNVETVLFAGELSEKSSITSFAFPLAAKKDSPALRDGCTTLHPSWGTAPYTPPRYFL
jgi:hypothetical protein